MKTPSRQRFGPIGRACLAFSMLSSQFGCSGMFFYPQREHVSTPATFELQYHDVEIVTEDSVRLHAWYIPAEGEKRGTVLHFHGNAENMSTHIFSVYWLPRAGYDVITFDYRGFGISEGKARFPEIVEDGKAAILFAQSFISEDAPCFFVLGQSLGGAIALLALDELKQIRPATALILDSSFSDFRKIIDETLSKAWILSPLLPFAGLFVPEAIQPVDAVGRLRGVPVLVIHGTADSIVPVSHAENLYEAAKTPKELWEIPGGLHIDALSRPGVRQEFLDYLNENCQVSFSVAGGSFPSELGGVEPENVHNISGSVSAELEK